MVRVQATQIFIVTRTRPEYGWISLLNRRMGARVSSSDQSGALKTARELCFLNPAGQLDCQPPTGGVYQPVWHFQKQISVHLALTKAGNNGGSLPFKGPQQRTKRKCIKRLGQSANANCCSVDCFVRHGWHFRNASPMFYNDEMWPSACQ